MFEYLIGRIIELTPTSAILEVGSVGYHINISLQSYTAIQKAGESPLKIYIHEHIREDVWLLYGFFSKEERSVFRTLITVSGIGSNTARLMLSSATTEELTTAIAGGNVSFLKNIKGIGQKSAERMIVELKDKMKQFGTLLPGMPLQSISIEEATSALISLGYAKAAVDKLISRHSGEIADFSVEQIIKYALQRL